VGSSPEDLNAAVRSGFATIAQRLEQLTERVTALETAFMEWQGIDTSLAAPSAVHSQAGSSAGTGVDASSSPEYERVWGGSEGEDEDGSASGDPSTTAEVEARRDSARHRKRGRS
jgi:hypothetical protein